PAEATFAHMPRRFSMLLLTCLLVYCTGVQAQEANALIAEGDTLLAANNGNKAMEKFEAALLLGATADAYAARARGWFHQSKHDKFLADVRTALGLDSLHAQANYQRAFFALLTNDNLNAVRFATRVVEDDARPPLRKRALVLRGEAQALLGLNDKAIADLAEGLEDNTGDLPAMKTLARLYDR